MAGGRSRDEEHTENGGGYLFLIWFLKAAQPSGVVHWGKEEQTLEGGMSSLSEGNGMRQFTDTLQIWVGCGSCLMLRPKYLKEEIVVTREPSVSSGGTSSHPTQKRCPRQTGTTTFGGARSSRWPLR